MAGTRQEVVPGKDPEPETSGEIQPIGHKFGVPVYGSNPSIPRAEDIRKRKQIRVGDDRRGFVVDGRTGEVIGLGGMSFYEFEEVDNTRFVKLFLAGVKQTAGLSKPGLAMFEVVYRQIQGAPNTDRVTLTFYDASKLIEGLSVRSFQRGTRELLDKKFLFRSPAEGVYFVNVLYMFNGDRLAFVRGYRRKGSGDQAELFGNDSRSSTAPAQLSAEGGDPASVPDAGSE